MALTEESRNAIADEAGAVAEKLRPSAAELDARGASPEEHLDALAEAGLAGLLISQDSGGRGGDLTSLALVSEAVGWAHGSTGLCFLMHLCGTATIGAKATPDQAREWLEPAAAGGPPGAPALSGRGRGAPLHLPPINA